MSIKNQLKNIDIKKIKMDNGNTVEENLITEANRLKAIIEKHLQKALLTQPVSYAFNQGRRTGTLENSLHVGNVKSVLRLNGSRFEVDVYFDENANSSSGYGVWNSNRHSGDEVNLPLLLNDGYTVKRDVWFADIPNFGFRKSTEFLENAIDEFNQVNQMSIYIDYETDVKLI